MSLLIIAVVVFLIIIFYIIWQNNELKKFETTVYRIDTDINESTKDNSLNCDNKVIWTKFVVLADLHNHIYGEGNDKLLRAIDDVSPDFIIIAGDMMIAKPGYNLSVTFDLIGKLSKKYKIYYGMGNHEYRLKIYPGQYGGLFDTFVEFLKKNNVVLLDNNTSILDINGKKLVITGLEIERNYYKRFVNINMDKSYISSLVGEKIDEYTILIAHNPEYFETYCKWGADLTLSGHVHGGMVRLPFIGGVLSPKIRIFPKYDSGLFEKNGKKMILSRGLGMHTIPIRINNRAELVLVELLKEG